MSRKIAIITIGWLLIIGCLQLKQWAETTFTPRIVEVKSVAIIYEDRILNLNKIENRRYKITALQAFRPTRVPFESEYNVYFIDMGSDKYEGIGSRDGKFYFAEDLKKKEE